MFKECPWCSSENVWPFTSYDSPVPWKGELRALTFMQCQDCGASGPHTRDVHTAVVEWGQGPRHIISQVLAERNETEPEPTEQSSDE